MRTVVMSVALPAMALALAAPTAAQLPDPGMEIDPERTALVITDPQSAVTNFRFIANTVWTTEQAVTAMTAGR